MITVPLWHRGDRVRVLQGEHEGRTGTVSMLPSDPLARLINLKIPYVKVALDGEPGQISTDPGERARGGRGGEPIVIDSDHLAAYDGPSGRAVSISKGDS